MTNFLTRTLLPQIVLSLLTLTFPLVRQQMTGETKPVAVFPRH